MTSYTPSTSYAELHCISNFSFLRGASHPQELVMRAAELGYDAIAITDECSFAGIVKAHVAARECNIKLLIGSEFRLDENLHFIAIAPDKRAYSELSSLITLARRRSGKGEYQLRWRDIEFNLRHNLIIWKPSPLHPDNERTTNNERNVGNDRNAEKLQRLFAGRLWIGASNLLHGDEPEYFDECRRLGQRWEIPVLACGAVHMHSRERHMLQDALAAIAHNTSVDKLDRKSVV